jgi:endonuclease/exonuclease/phosphatase family metal-dependent hydrolase
LVPLFCLAASAFLLNVSKPGARVLGCLQGCSTGAAEAGAPALVVLSLNMLHGRPDFEHLDRRLDLIAAEIRRQEADIVCLQETPWRPGMGYAAARLAAETGMNHAYLRANGNRWTIRFEEGLAILSRYPIRQVDFAELLPRAGVFEHRVVLHAVIGAPQGDLEIFVTHLTNGDAQVNAAQAEDLRRYIEATRAGPAIVAGDFNAREDEPQIQSLAPAWVDAYRLAQPEDAGRTCCIDDLTAGPAEPLEARIDYIFLAPGADPGYTLVRARRVLDEPYPSGGGWLWASDHVGLLVEVAP